jgi:ring-1,2-phenylacetyl-CoA epoxidase subunit PaaD
MTAPGAFTEASNSHGETRGAPIHAGAKIARAWQALAGVLDPELPVLSIVELGIVRGVRIDDSTLVIDVTPTYSGCPATEAIQLAIRDALAEAGLADARVAIGLAPPWTTDWIAPEGKRKLRDFGIAPPHAGGTRVDISGISPLRRSGAAVPCPRCASTRTRLLAQFGSTACKAQYRCDACLEPFDYFKPH